MDHREGTQSRAVAPASKTEADQRRVMGKQDISRRKIHSILAYPLMNGLLYLSWSVMDCKKRANEKLEKYKIMPSKANA